MISEMTQCFHLCWKRKGFLITLLAVDLQKWAEGKGLAIDVAVTSPLAPTYIRHKEPCEWYAATQKHGKYDLTFAGTEYLFSAVVFETLGAINVEGEELLRMI